MIAAALVRAELMQKLAEQARTDELTGLLNRREWDRQLRLAIARCTRTNQPLSVVVMDVDGLKQVNDTDGHAAGDRYLQDISAAWAGTIRETDSLGRIGGDEFALLLEGADGSAATDTLARLRRLDAPGRRASAGIATWQRPEDPADLIARADAAMYEDKQRARAERARERRAA
jgi:diguanylate cyclase (GGDEF)-like protein